MFPFARIGQSQFLARIAPDLDTSDVELHELSLHRDGPALRVRFDLPRTISSERWPKAWHAQQANTVQVTLLCVGVRSVAIDGWATTVRGALTVDDAGATLRVSFAGERSHLELVADALVVEAVSAHRAE